MICWTLSLRVRGPSNNCSDMDRACFRFSARPSSQGLFCESLKICNCSLQN